MMALEVHGDPDALANRVATWFIGLARAKSGRFAVALSGGVTPRRLYELLATSPYREAAPWSRIHWFWGDERFVPPTDSRSNFAMVRQALFARTPIPARNIHPIPTGRGLSPEAAALAYEATLVRFYGASQLIAGRPLFDLVLLGLGTDGHTASLFPGSPALDEMQAWVVAVRGEGPSSRISLTYPALESASQVAFLVAGAEKRAVLSRLLLGVATCPAARLRPEGSLRVFADAAAHP